MTLEEQVAALKGESIKMDFTARDGRVVDAFVAQIDLDVGLTVRGCSAFCVEEEDSAEIELYCLNKSRIGSTLHGAHVSYQTYLAAMTSFIQDVKQGVHIVPPSGGYDGGGSTSCAF